MLSEEILLPTVVFINTSVNIEGKLPFNENTFQFQEFITDVLVVISDSIYRVAYQFPVSNEWKRK